MLAELLDAVADERASKEPQRQLISSIRVCLSRHRVTSSDQVSNRVHRIILQVPQPKNGRRWKQKQRIAKGPLWQRIKGAVGMDKLRIRPKIRERLPGPDEAVGES